MSTANLGPPAFDPSAAGAVGVTADPLIGRHFGNYVVQDLLGRGGMGAVYLAENARIGRKVAIKILSPLFAAMPQGAQRFEAEARILSRVDHPNVVTLFDFGATDDGLLYCVMEALQGRDLQRVMGTQPSMVPEDVFAYASQICAGLQAAHDKGVVHRDLKPENVFVLDGPELRVKILDFGIAKLLEGDRGVTTTSTGMVLGTPLFISPEQAAGVVQAIGPASDVYSLGVMLYWMLCGAPPFVSPSAPLLLAKHIQEPPPPLAERAPHLPAALVELVQRCLAKDPVARPQSPAAVAAGFAAALGLPTGPLRRGLSGETPLRSGAHASHAALAETQAASSQPGTITAGGAAGELVKAMAGRSRRPVALWLGAAVVLCAAGAGLFLALGRSGPSTGPAAVEKGASTGPARPAMGAATPRPRDLSVVARAEAGVAPDAGHAAAVADRPPVPAIRPPGKRKPPVIRPHKGSKPKAARPPAPGHENTAATPGPVNPAATPEPKKPPEKIGEGTMEIEVK